MFSKYQQKLTSLRQALTLVLAFAIASLPTWVQAESDIAAGSPGLDFAIELATEVPALRDATDPELQQQLDALLSSKSMQRAIQQKRFSAALVDITDPTDPRMASVNGDKMVYAASLPKIAILLGAFEQVERGEMQLDAKTKNALTQMIRKSSNSAATAMYYAVGPARLAEILQSDKYGLYDREYAGGLWVGKAYAKKNYWKRDPLNNISHGASAIQVARFFYLLENGKLASETASAQMKEILGNPGIHHKFVKGLANRPGSKIFRKSGSWRTYHTDAAIIERDGRRYIAVMLANDVKGGQWLTNLIVGFDNLIHRAGNKVALAN